MSAEKEVGKKSIVIDGISYDESNLTTQQRILIRQINLCSLKVTKLELEIGRLEWLYQASLPPSRPRIHKLSQLTKNWLIGLLEMHQGRKSVLKPVAKKMHLDRR